MLNEKFLFIALSPKRISKTVKYKGGYTSALIIAAMLGRRTEERNSDWSEPPFRIPIASCHAAITLMVAQKGLRRAFRASRL